ncbi:MAG: PAS domain-containing protein [bacterium]|nr:PAS domain-containing protein [bacterium]
MPQKKKPGDPERAPLDLETLENYVRDLWRFLPLPLCSFNPMHKALDANAALASLSLYKEDEFVGQHLSVFFPKDKNPKNMASLVLEKESATQETNLQTKDGKLIPVNIYSQLRKDEKGETIGYFLGIVDMTKEREFKQEMEERVRQQTRQLEEKVGELERFQKIAVGRELKMVELKEMVEKAEKNLQQCQKFNQKN